MNVDKEIFEKAFLICAYLRNQRQKPCSYRELNKCPIFSFLVLRYRSDAAVASGSQGTRSVTVTPAASSAMTFLGLFDRSRTALSPSSRSILAGSWNPR